MLHMQSNIDIIFKSFLQSRKISDKVISDFGIYVDNGRLVIPVNNPEGIVSFNKYRRSPLSDEGSKYTYDKGGHVTLYGADKIKDPEIKTVVVSEGETDCLVCWSQNIPAVSSTGGALSFQEEWAEMLKDKDVVLCFDNDAAGGEGMVRALRYIPHAKIMFIPDRPGVKDISDYVASGGDLNALLRTAKLYSSIEEVISDKADRESIWQSVYFHTAYIKEHTKPAPRVRTPRDPKLTDKIMRAKAYPIEDMVVFNRGQASCLFHSERESSLHLYKEQNRVWCFGGCGRGYDAIDVYMKLNNCGFKEAVTQMQ